MPDPVLEIDDVFPKKDQISRLLEIVNMVNLDVIEITGLISFNGEIHITGKLHGKDNKAQSTLP
jgi:hypothetical protein